MTIKAWKDKTADEIINDIAEVAEIMRRPYTGPMPPDLLDPEYGWLILNGEVTEAGKQWAKDHL